MGVMSLMKDSFHVQFSIHRAKLQFSFVTNCIHKSDPLFMLDKSDALMFSFLRRMMAIGCGVASRTVQKYSLIQFDQMFKITKKPFSRTVVETEFCSADLKILIWCTL